LIKGTQVELLEKILTSPSLIWVLTAIGFYFANIFVGLFNTFQKKTKQNLRIHKWLYYSIGFSLVCFLIMNQIHHENSPIDYMISLYIVLLVPYSKRWNSLIHALIALVGFTLLPLLIVVQI